MNISPKSQLFTVLICFFPLLGMSYDPPSGSDGSNFLLLEINMIESDSSTKSYLKDTLSINIFETTTGDEYCAKTTTGSISIPLSSDKHYFIYMSKTGAVTEFIEFQTAGLQNSDSRMFFADYDPVSIEDYDGYSMNYPMSVIKFIDDEYGTVEINNVGINVLCEEQYGMPTR